MAEAAHAEAALVAAGVPIVGRLTGDARADGGDLMWLDDGALLAGRTYRTNAAAHLQLADLLAASGHRLVRADMPHDRGRAHVLHLMSVVSMITEQLAVVFEPLSPVPLLEELRARDIDWIAVEEDDYLAMGVNVLSVRPGVVVMVAGTPRVRAALEARGVEVHVFDGSQLSLKGDGGPTCLTRPLWRASRA
jgi:N-dimethylarginine dimethylaminohydrolase